LPEFLSLKIIRSLHFHFTKIPEKTLDCTIWLTHTVQVSIDLTKAANQAWVALADSIEKKVKDAPSQIFYNFWDGELAMAVA
jgi:hypothetical protein